MTMNSQRASATIYQFPPRGRFAAAEQRDASRAAINPMLQRAAQAAVASAWYHEDAIRDAEPTRTK